MGWFEHSFLITLVLEYLTYQSICSTVIHLNSKLRNHVKHHKLKQLIDQQHLPYISGHTIITGVREVSNIELLKRFTDENLRRIEFEEQWNELESGVLPSHVTYLRFGDYFTNHGRKLTSDSNFISDRVTHLIFGRRWKNGGERLMAGAFSANLVHLDLGVDFKNARQLIQPGVLPCHLMYLKLTCPFVPGAIPDSVERLDFSYWFNSELLPGHIPNTVRWLQFGDRYDNGGVPLKEGAIPYGVETLIFGSTFKNAGRALQPRVIPDSVTELDLGVTFRSELKPDVIPKSVITLTLGGNFSNGGLTLSPQAIPVSVKHLSVSKFFLTDLALGALPSSITHLTLRSISRSVVRPGVIPDGVRFVHSSSNFTLAPGALPRSVISLTSAKG